MYKLFMIITVSWLHSYMIYFLYTVHFSFTTNISDYRLSVYVHSCMHTLYLSCVVIGNIFMVFKLRSRLKWARSRPLSRI